jgi:hypothetical protein
VVFSGLEVVGIGAALGVTGLAEAAGFSFFGGSGAGVRWLLYRREGCIEEGAGTLNARWWLCTALLAPRGDRSGSSILELESVVGAGDAFATGMLIGVTARGGSTLRGRCRFRFGRAEALLIDGTSEAAPKEAEACSRDPGARAEAACETI